MRPTNIVFAERAIRRASSGLYYLQDILMGKTGGTDAAFSRSRYLLLSYNFELILNSLLCLASDELTEAEIINSIKRIRPPHDFEKMFLKLPTNLTNAIGLQTIKKIEGEFTRYEVTTVRGKLTLEDLIDVRYDFKKDKLRKMEPEETPRIKTEVGFLISMCEEVEKIILKKI